MSYKSRLHSSPLFPHVYHSCYLYIGVKRTVSIIQSIAMLKAVVDLYLPFLFFILKMLFISGDSESNVQVSLESFDGNLVVNL